MQRAVTRVSSSIQASLSDLVRILFLVPPMSLPPLPDSLVDDFPRNTIIDEFHDDAQGLDVLVPALVVKEEHLFVREAGPFVQACKVRRLAPGVYLEVVKGRDGLDRRAVDRRRRQTQIREHFAGEFGRAGPRRSGELQILLLDLVRRCHKVSKHRVWTQPTRRDRSLPPGLGWGEGKERKGVLEV